jgi:hypothetical protein
MAIEPSFVAFSQAPFLELASSTRLQPVILIGSEGRLDVLVSFSNMIELLGALHGLPGTVVDARFCLGSMTLIYTPLVALTLHGPKFANESDPLIVASHDELVTTGGRRSNVAILGRPEYQTRVDIYFMEPAFRGQVPQLPEPTDVQGSNPIIGRHLGAWT